MPGNVFIPATTSGLGQLPFSLMHEVGRGLRQVLGL
jgi:hypothetical protein